MPVYGLNKTQWIQVVSSWGGWLMDGYVTIAYAFVIGTVSTLFFPADSIFGGHSLLLALLGLAVGAIARSFGSLYLGSTLGDRLGRKTMLTVTIILFSLFSTLIGLLPTYANIGVYAPILLYILLFLVGLFAGAEYGGGAALSSESVPVEKRGFVGAFVQSGFGTGFFVVSFVYSFLQLSFPGSAFAFIGWRILFFSTAIPGIMTLVIRKFTPESKVFKDAVKDKKIERIPALSMLKDAAGPMLFAIMITTGLLYINTGTFSFYASVLSIFLKVNGVQVGFIVAIINLISLFGVWTGGVISNLVGGRRTSMIIYTAAFMLLSYPLIRLGYSHVEAYQIIGFGIQAFVEALIFSTLPAFLSETFSKRYRTTAVGFTYNAGGIGGGFAATIIAIFATTGNLPVVWAGNLVIAGGVMMVGILLSKETWSSRSKERHVDRIVD